MTLSISTMLTLLLLKVQIDPFWCFTLNHVLTKKISATWFSRWYARASFDELALKSICLSTRGTNDSIRT